MEALGGDLPPPREKGRRHPRRLRRVRRATTSSSSSSSSTKRRTQSIHVRNRELETLPVCRCPTVDVSYSTNSSVCLFVPTISPYRRHIFPAKIYLATFYACHNIVLLQVYVFFFFLCFNRPDPIIRITIHSFILGFQPSPTYRSVYQTW